MWCSVVSKALLVLSEKKRIVKSPRYYNKVSRFVPKISECDFRSKCFSDYSRFIGVSPVWMVNTCQHHLVSGILLISLSILRNFKVVKNTEFLDTAKFKIQLFCCEQESLYDKSCQFLS